MLTPPARILPVPAWIAILLTTWVASFAQDLRLPNKPASVKFLVLGDSGTGDSEQYAVGERASEFHARFPFTFAILLGDNIYGSDKPKDFEKKFERPYAKLLAAGVKFYASLGNHDNPNQRFYKHFNMNGERYYSFLPAPGVRFFALDTTYFDRRQLAWVETELQKPSLGWKIAFFHHPLYSGGRRHGPHMEWRAMLEPLFIANGVNVVFSGHEHFYERIRPQHGIYYWIAGSSAKLRRSNIQANPETAKGFDQDYVFMLVEIDGDLLYFQAITRAGVTIDAGVIAAPKAPPRILPGPGLIPPARSAPSGTSSR